MEVIMDSKEQALEKALGYVRKNMDKSISVQEKDNQYIVFDKTGYRVATYQFAPPREAPARGTIVEVWDNSPGKRLKYSTGVLNNHGFICVNPCSDFKYVEDSSYWPNWRVVGEQGDLVPMYETVSGKCDDIGCTHCDRCDHADKCYDEEPCASCKTTVPTNYEAQ
jgi:hypothetical protein